MIDPGNPLVLILGGLLAVAILRPVFLWYWKLDRIASLLESIDERLKDPKP